MIYICLTVYNFVLHKISNFSINCGMYEIYISDLLYAPEETPNRIPSPHDLMGKIVIKVSIYIFLSC